MEFTIRPIAFVQNARTEAIDDHWGPIVSEIRLEESLPAECFEGIEGFSHLEVVFVFDKAVGITPTLGKGHPRENPAWPEVGIYAQRKRLRPNFIGCTHVKLLRHEGRSLFVERLDAIDGTPIIDIKPVVREFLPEGEIVQPWWVETLMKEYW